MLGVGLELGGLRVSLWFRGLGLGLDFTLWG